MLQGDAEIELALQRVGELLIAQGLEYSIAIIGGAAVNLLGHVRRATSDVDILAFADQSGETLRRPDEPLPEPLVRAARVVAGDLGLDPDWLNSGPALQWQTGLPPGLEGRIEWRVYSGLRVGLVGRYDLIFFKLYAAVDDIGPGSALSGSRGTEADCCRTGRSSELGQVAGSIGSGIDRARQGD